MSPESQEPDPRRTRLPAEERRALIVAAGARLFAARGYAATTLEEIASAAGVTKPVLYRHFASKRDLYLALLAKHRRDLPSFFEGVRLTGGESPERALRVILARWFDYIAVNSHAWEMLFRDSSGDDEIRAFRTNVSLRAREVIAEFLVAGGSSMPAEQIAPTAELLTSGLAGLALWSIDHPDIPRPALIEVAVRMSTPAFG